MPTIAEVLNALQKKVIERGEFDEDDQAKMRGLMQGAGYSDGAQVWRVGEANDGLACFAIFEGNAREDDDYMAGDVRVYACTADPRNPYARFKFNRGAPTSTRFLGSEEAWLDEIVAEWAAILYEEEDDAVTCDKCGAETSVTHEDEEKDVETKFCANCGNSLLVTVTEEENPLT